MSVFESIWLLCLALFLGGQFAFFYSHHVKDEHGKAAFSLFLAVIVFVAILKMLIVDV